MTPRAASIPMEVEAGEKTMWRTTRMARMTQRLRLAWERAIRQRVPALEPESNRRAQAHRRFRPLGHVFRRRLSPLFMSPSGTSGERASSSSAPPPWPPSPSSSGPPVPPASAGICSPSSSCWASPRSAPSRGVCAAMPSPGSPPFRSAPSFWWMASTPSSGALSACC